MFFSWRKFGVVEALGGGGYRQDSEPVGESFLDGQGSDLLLPYTQGLSVGNSKPGVNSGATDPGGARPVAEMLAAV